MKGAILPDPIELVALDPARNIRRRYSIVARFDLFGMIVVETRWGRVGARGQAQHHAFDDHAAADRHIAATLRRRGTAENRIGVVYKTMTPASGSAEAG
ncbi:MULTISPECIES: WGR domain-containing protein [Sphingomonadaceae]|uniref:WGR domain-containing protein n=1 Tax=Rhizorhabdus dicambivorans TaxID=1850238 RepID=A0A2A4FQ47_9SPHN|nr:MULTISPECIES: WGR domain-containing protein [Sphingomonadaceae]ATE67997.1 WGR domain-containing protein [Rhizorhabdus dicambivorans]ATE68022.1 WGR domain-containing protein [Rhizorhabdus dicambivorans]PCE39832.1 WGR domain-containing protein [Rhizorhabdus dicambivorans]